MGYHKEDSILYDQVSTTRATEVLWDIRVERSPRFLGVYFYKLWVLLGRSITNEILFTNLYLYVMWKNLKVRKSNTILDV